MFRLLPAAAALLTLIAAPLAAQSGPWGGRDGWPRRDNWSQRDAGRSSADREGKVSTAAFRADGEAALALGKGAIAVALAPDYSRSANELESATYDAAVLDALARSGYSISGPAAEAGQQVELRVSHDIAVPEELPRKPLSGDMSVGVGSHGSGMGLGPRLDLTKPKKALVLTRLEARIRDKVSGALLWEGRADILTRDGSKRWDASAIATRLAQALFERFPAPTG